MELFKFDKSTITVFLRPYASVFFCYSPWVGLWFAILSFCSPRTAFAALFSLVCAWFWGKVLAIKPPGDLHLVNALLCGLFLSANYPLSVNLFVGLALVTIFMTICVNWLTPFLWYIGRIPLMTLPFVLGTWLVILVFQEANVTSLPPIIFLSETLPDALSSEWSNDFFSALGGLLLVPYPLTGALLFIGLFIASRYLAFLAVSGYIIGCVTLSLLGYDFLQVKSGYNFMLVAMALGGIFMVPSRPSYIIAMGGSALSCLFVVALYKVLDPLQLPVLIMPFLLSTYFWIGGLGPRIDKNKGLLYLDAPVSPEIAWENSRLNNARGFSIAAQPIIKLFKGIWRVEHDAEVNATYFSIETKSPDETLEILSPADGIVLSLRNMTDQSQAHPWDIALNANWGSFVLLRDRFGQYIFLPKLMTDTIKPKPNDWVVMSQPIAQCGKSKDGSRLCLYLQYQKGPLPTSEKIPFHLVNVISFKPNEPKHFNLYYFPVPGEYVTHVFESDLIASIHLPPGLARKYRVKEGDQPEYQAMTRTELTPTGQPRFAVGQDCSAAYELSPACLIFYDKQGKPNILLDLLMLSLGVTPLAKLAETWTDEPSVTLWPLTIWQRMLLAVVRPLGLGCKSVYTRYFDETSNSWIQSAVHRAHVMPGLVWEAKTIAKLDPSIGVYHVRLETRGKSWEIRREDYKS